MAFRELRDLSPLMGEPAANTTGPRPQAIQPKRSVAPSVRVARAREEADAYLHIIAHVNDRWRVIVCRDGLQWILQQRRGQRDGQARWHSRRYHVERTALLRSIGELCSDATSSALHPSIARLPARFEGGARN